MSAGRASIMASMIMLTLVAIALPSTADCRTYHYRYIDPVGEYEIRYDHDSINNCSGEGQVTRIECDVTPLVEIGEPTIHGYRHGVYAYECDASSGVGMTVVGADFGGTKCQYVPYLAVGGEQVPGTDETYCSPPEAYVPAESPEVVPSTGVFIVYRGLNGYDTYLVIDAANLASTCSFPFTLTADPETMALYAEAAGMRVTYLTCPYY